MFGIPRDSALRTELPIWIHPTGDLLPLEVEVEAMTTLPFYIVAQGFIVIVVGKKVRLVW